MPKIMFEGYVTPSGNKKTLKGNENIIFYYIVVAEQIYKVEQFFYRNSSPTFVDPSCYSCSIVGSKSLLPHHYDYTKSFIWNHKSWLIVLLYFPLFTCSFIFHRGSTQCFIDMPGINKWLGLLRGIINWNRKSKNLNFKSDISYKPKPKHLQS